LELAYTFSVRKFLTETYRYIDVCAGGWAATRAGTGRQVLADDWRTTCAEERIEHVTQYHVI